MLDLYNYGFALKLIANDTGLEYDEVKYWFSARKSLNVTPKLIKFSESCWRFTYYLLIWFYGLYVVHDVSRIFSFFQKNL